VDDAARWAARACLTLERSVYDSRPVAEILGKLGLGYRQLARHVRRVRGTTPKQYHLRCRLQEGARLLRGSRQSITDIALDLGFSSSQHFSTAFRRQVGCSPGAYRRLPVDAVASRLHRVVPSRRGGR
jgi:AraC-like DNA-binding protein